MWIFITVSSLYELECVSLLKKLRSNLNTVIISQIDFLLQIFLWHFICSFEAVKMSFSIVS